RLQPGWHLYALDVKGPIATSFQLTGNKILASQGKPIQPKPPLVDEPTFGKIGEFENAVAFAIPVKIAATASGSQSATVKITDQTCNAKVCTPVETIDLAVAFNVASGPARPDHLAALTAVPPQPAGYSSSAGSPSSEPSDEV